MPDATMAIETQIVLTDTKGIRKKIPITTPAIASQKEVLQMELTIPVSSIVIAWDPITWTGFPIPAFKAILIYSDYQVKIEEVVKEGDASRETNVHVLEPYTPYILGSNVSTISRSLGDGLAGTDDVIDRIRIENESPDQAAKVYFLIVDDS